MHTTSTCSARGSVAARSDVFAACWESPRYLAMHALKDRLHSAWMRSETYPYVGKESANRRFTRVVRAISRFEDRALVAAGLRP